MVLKVTKEDSERFLSSGNFEPSFFKKPGQAIYNNYSGLPEENQYFNVAWVDEKIFQFIEKAVKARQTDSGEVTLSVRKKVFDPYTHVYFAPPPKATPGYIRLNLGEPFFMSQRKHHSILLTNKHPSSIALGSLNAEELVRTSLNIIRQVPEEVNVHYLAGDRIKEITGESEIKIARTFKIISSEEEFENTLDEMQRCSREKIKNILICPDIGDIRFFKPAGYSKSKLAEEFMRCITDGFDFGCVVVFGARNKQKLRDCLDFNKISADVYHRILLSSGTSLEQDYDLPDASIRSGMANYCCAEETGKIMVYKQYSD